MAGKQVVIKYQYFEVCCMDGDDRTEMLYNLEGWVHRINTIPLPVRLKDVNGIKGRIENVDRLLDDQYISLNFMRLEELSNTYKVKENTAAEHIDLELDEYIGKNTVVLYDPRLHVVMVQCNRGSYGVTAIESYINSFNVPNDLCYFRPIDNAFDSLMLQRGKTTHLDIRFANTRQFVARNSRHLERFLETCNEMESFTAHIEIGLGYTRGGALNNETISAAINDLRNPGNRESVSSAKVTLNEDQKSSVFDLFENIINDKISYIVPARGELAYNFMADKMAERYDGRTRAQVLNLLKH